MEDVADVLSNVSLLTFVLLFVVCLAQWWRNKAASFGWATATFGSLAIVGITSLIVGRDAELPRAVVNPLLALIVAFPYLLFRFTMSFEPASRALHTVATALTGVVVAISVALPTFPQHGGVRPGWFYAYLAALLIQWTTLFVISARRLWRAGRGQPTLSRRRMKTLALAAIGLNLSILISGAAGGASERPGVEIVTSSITLVATLMFFLGIAPPRALRVMWRQPEQAALARATSGLMRATTIEEVTTTLLPHAARLMGARAVAYFDATGNVVASEGIWDGASAEAVRVEMPSGTLAVAASPYTPFFGREEVELLDNLGALAALAIERCTTFEREREFIANAAHELRTPLATITGLAATLAEHGTKMSEERVLECLHALDRQGLRAVSLVNNLLDLAHVEHAGVPVAPTSLAVTVAHALDTAPPPHGVQLRATVPDDVEVLADEGRLTQVLTNLLTNAYRYGGQHVDVIVEVADDVEVAIQDDGPGVPPDLVPHLFDPFTRAKDAVVPGSGLGLAISRELVRAFGGDLRYEPRAPHGARFVFRLRRAS